MKPGKQVRIQSQGVTLLRGHSNGRSFSVKLPGRFQRLKLRYQILGKLKIEKKNHFMLNNTQSCHIFLKHPLSVRREDKYLLTGSDHFMFAG